MRQIATGIREFQIVLRSVGHLRRVCKFAFSNSDSSIYLVPYAAGGTYFFGTSFIPEQQAKHTFSFAEQQSSETAPKVSIHDSGRVHVRVGRQQAGPLTIPALSQLTGEHVASVSIDHFDSLPLLSGKPKVSGSGVDTVLDIPSGLASVRFAIYVNGATPSFKSSHMNRIVRIMRPCLKAPVYIGIAALGQEALGAPSTKRGVTVICGWNPEAATDFLYLRGQ